MQVDTDPEDVRLRAVLRDLLALSGISALWIGREPSAVAAGLADALVELLQLDFVFVRLSDPGGAAAVDATRGSAWKSYSEWLEGHLATRVPLPRKEIVLDVGGSPRHGVVVPIGVSGEAGLVATACERPDFPTPTDQLLLSHAANHAATAFQSARLIYERKRAEKELREARDELKRTVAERTAELDRLFTLSPDLITVAGFDGFWKQVNPAFQTRLGYTEREALARPYLEFVHPDDRERSEAEALRLLGGKTIHAFENRMVCKDGSYRWIEWTVAPVLEEGLLYGVGRDVTERHTAESELRRVVREQAALRRVATLVAQGVQPVEIFSAVSEEVSGLFGSGAAVLRFEHDPPGVVFVGISKGMEIPIGTCWAFQEGMASAEVYRTGRSARVDRMDWSSSSGPVAATARRLGIVSTVVSPVVVEGRLWGAMTVSASEAVLRLHSEERLDKFTELVATAIANAESKSELAASRLRIVAASDEARRRIERDLHDGTQQRLVSLALAVRTAEDGVPPQLGDLRGKLSRVAMGLADAVTELRELSRGIHPAILSEGGLRPALRALARRSAVPIKLDVTADARLPEPIEVAAYYVASEALANATKHAQASLIEVSLTTRNGNVLLSIRDDGVGGADPARGSGLVGLTDRVEALGGSVRVHSRPGEGTHITAELPITLKVGTTPEQPSA